MIGETKNFKVIREGVTLETGAVRPGFQDTPSLRQNTEPMKTVRLNPTVLGTSASPWGKGIFHHQGMFWIAMAKRSFFTLAFVAAVLLANQTAQAQKQPTKVFVLTGQSNSLGPSADKTEKDITPGTDPLDAQIPFFWANRSTRAGDGAAALIDSSGGKLLSLCTQKGEGVSSLFWGPEIKFARHLAAGGMKDFLIVKASRGGGGNSFWLKGSSDDHMYRHVVDTVKQAINALPPGTSVEIAALLYVQGESDSSAEAAVAGERLLLLASNLRRDLPNAATMKVIIGGIANAGSKSDTVRAQQSALPAKDPTFRYIDTVDLRSKLYDGLHFNKTAKLELGLRMAKVWMKWNILAKRSVN
ncbi:MAG: sialate O-acetylesterase [Victivallales bacterium]